jgi:3-deoxy-D-manno-octulosonic-acid transferase
MTAPLVLSTITPTGFQVARRLTGEQGAVIYAPFDFRWTVQRALRTIRPRALILVEAELWPNLIHLTRAHGVPIALVNGRISSRAVRRARWGGVWFRRTLARIDLFLMQTPVDAERIVLLGAPADRVRVLGSLKWDASLTTAPPSEQINAAADQLGLKPEEPLIVAGSTHRPEEQAVLEAFGAARQRLPQARLILAPRHIERVAFSLRHVHAERTGRQTRGEAAIGVEERREAARVRLRRGVEREEKRITLPLDAFDSRALRHETEPRLVEKRARLLRRGAAHVLRFLQERNERPFVRRLG